MKIKSTNKGTTPKKYRKLTKIIGIINLTTPNTRRKVKTFFVNITRILMALSAPSAKTPRKELVEAPKPEPTSIQLAKVGYAGLMLERWPFNDDPNNCSSPESAYLLHLEKKILEEIPEYLDFKTIKHAMDSEHRDRIELFFEEVKKARQKLSDQIEVMQKHHQATPKVCLDPRAEVALQMSPTKIVERHRKVIIATICCPEDEYPPLGNQAIASADNESVTPKKIMAFFQKALLGLGRSNEDRQNETYLRELKEYEARNAQRKYTKHWKTEDENQRRSLYERHKNYMTTLMIYLQMLDEESTKEEDLRDKTKKRQILPINNPHKQEIKKRIEELRTIMGYHAIVSLGKAVISGLPPKEKEKSLIRKTTPEASMLHPVKVLLRGIRNRLAMPTDQDPVNPVFIEGSHDLSEDSRLSEREVSHTQLPRFTGCDDTTFDQKIHSGIPGRTREEFKKRALNLVDKATSNEILAALRILNNHTELTNNEKRRLIEISPSTRPAPYNPLIKKVKKRKKAPAAPTLDKHTKEYDNRKVMNFIMRLFAIKATNMTKRDTLNTKIQDRTDNIETLKGMELNARKACLRATASRLIPFIVHDYPNLDFAMPLGNAPHELISATQKAYAEFKEDFPNEEFTEMDQKLMNSLESLQSTLEQNSPKQHLPEEYLIRERAWHTANPRPLAD